MTRGHYVDVSAAWKQHEDLVRWSTWRIIRRYGGDFDELFSEALVLFTSAAQSYDPKMGSFSNWITFRIYKGLQEIKRSEARRLRIAGPRVGLDHASNMEQKTGLMEELSKLLSSESLEVVNILFSLDDSQFKNKSLLKLFLRKTLRQLDFSNEKISECFSEIEAALVT